MNQHTIWARKLRELCCNRFVPPTPDSLPDDVATLKEAQAKARNAESEVRVRELLIEQITGQGTLQNPMQEVWPYDIVTSPALQAKLTLLMPECTIFWR